jgi:hypothetical protein
VRGVVLWEESIVTLSILKMREEEEEVAVAEWVTAEVVEVEAGDKFYLL